MSRLVTLLIISLLVVCSCSTEPVSTKENSYFKILVFGDSPMPNAYNKGVGTEYYLDFNPNTNSVVYLYPEYSTDDNQLSYKNHLLIGRFDSKFRDRLMLLKNALNWRRVGTVDSIPENSTYCGWEYFVEYKDGPDYKYYSVTQAVNDTLDMFFDFLRDLENSK